MQMKRQEVAARRLPAQLKRHFGDFFIGNARLQSPQAAQPLYIRHGFDIKCKNWNH